MYIYFLYVCIAQCMSVNSFYKFHWYSGSHIFYPHHKRPCVIPWHWSCNQAVITHYCLERHSMPPTQLPLFASVYNLAPSLTYVNSYPSVGLIDTLTPDPSYSPYHCSLTHLFTWHESTPPPLFCPIPAMPPLRLFTLKFSHQRIEWATHFFSRVATNPAMPHLIKKLWSVGWLHVVVCIITTQVRLFEINNK